MKCFLLLLAIVILSPITASGVYAKTVFSWVDAKGVMHFTDKKPSEVEVNNDLLITKIVEVTNILESDETISKHSADNGRHEESRPDSNDEAAPEISPENVDPLIESDSFQSENNITQS